MAAGHPSISKYFHRHVIDGKGLTTCWSDGMGVQKIAIGKRLAETEWSLVIYIGDSEQPYKTHDYETPEGLAKHMAAIVKITRWEALL